MLFLSIYLGGMGRGFSILGNIKAEQRVEKFRLKKFKLANLRTNICSIDVLHLEAVI